MLFIYITVKIPFFPQNLKLFFIFFSSTLNITNLNIFFLYIIYRNIMKEYDIQCSCVSWFHLNYPEYIIFSVPNEGCYRRKNYFENLGMLSGVSDTIVIVPNKTLFIEFKTSKSYQRKEQKDFENHVTQLGFSYYVVRSLEQFKEIITSELV